MDFAFTDEQQMLRDQVRSFVTDRFPPERVAALADSDERWDPSSFEAMAELGWTGLSVAEQQGGAGMTFVEEAVVFEELGYGLYPGPYLSTVALALVAVAEDDELVGRVIGGEAPATVAWIEPDGMRNLADVGAITTRAERVHDEWRLSGTKELVPDASSAGVVVVVATDADGPGLWSVDATEGNPEISVLSTSDRTRPLATIRFEDQPARLLAAGARATELLRTMRVRSLAAVALEGVGVAQKALELARDHATERRQFDKPIGTYQAISHQVSDTYVDVELARSLAYWAAWCVAEDEGAALAAATAKAFAAEAAVRACERSIQVHGGIGFTWEHVLHRYLKRAQWLDAFEGTASAHRADVATAILDR